MGIVFFVLTLAGLVSARQRIAKLLQHVRPALSDKIGYYSWIATAVIAVIFAAYDYGVNLGVFDSILGVITVILVLGVVLHAVQWVHAHYKSSATK